MDLVLVVDKPSGMTSHDVVARLKRSSGASKVGHAGTLDPGATGVLVVLLGRATRLADLLVRCEKEYSGRIVLGTETDTQDAEGRVTAEGDTSAVTGADVERAFRRFEGEIMQVPPMVSALKHEGRPLYVLARRGIVIEREARRVHVERLDLLGFNSPVVRFEIVCSRGTYVRTIASDVGRELGCGAHLGELTRTRVGPFGIGDAAALDELLAMGPDLGQTGLSLYDSLPFLAALRVTSDERDTLSVGGGLTIDGERIVPAGPRARGCAIADPELIRVADEGGSLVAVGRAGAVSDRPGMVHLRPTKVFVSSR